MLHLLATLPRRNEWVFPSNTSASGRLTEPNNPHTRACKAAGLEGLTLHGLHRSFKSLTEWLEVPLGVMAQIQGHKPSATAEKHYTVRPLELLRVHHERIKAWPDIPERGMTQGEAATLFRVTQPRVSDLVRGKLNLFSLDALMGMASTAGMSPMVKVSKPKVQNPALRRKRRTVLELAHA
jgi:predicted XRE-type DNA-binding protein